MQEQEDLAMFIEEQRAKIAYERDVLKNNPPSAITDNSMNRQILRRDKENQVPYNNVINQSYALSKKTPLPIQTEVRPPSTPRILRLGDDYNKKREKLKEELKADYRNAMAEKNLRTGRRHQNQSEVSSQIPFGGRTNSDLGLSLPLKDRLSAKERMRLQRNKEYNEFLHLEEEKREARSLSRSPVRSNIPATTTVTKIFAPPYSNNVIPNNDAITYLSQPAKDASIETYEELLERKRKQEKSYRGDDDEQDNLRDKPRYYNDVREEDDGYYSQKRVRFPSKTKRSQPRGHRSRRRDDSAEYDDNFTSNRSQRRRGRGRRRGRNRSSDEDSEYTSEEEERLPRRKRNASIEKRKGAPSFEREATTGSLRFSNDKQESSDHRSKSAPPEQEFTGLPIGIVSSANTVQRRKDEYRDELLRQMEDNKKMKKKERELDMELGGTSINISDSQPKKGRNTKDTSPPKRRAEDSPPPHDNEFSRKKKGKRSSLKYKIESSSDEDELPRRGVHRGSHPRQPYFAPPPQQPVGYFPQQYPNPYDDAYYYYGTRNPLDPGAVMSQPQQGQMYSGVSPLMAAAGMGHGAERSDSPNRSRNFTQQPAPNRRSFHINESSSLVADETRDGVKKKQQMAQYQEELKTQIAQKEKEKRTAKAERERYEMKLETEARNYNPWGKGGGGAPMKDRQGNLISDLRHMHIENEEAGRDPTKAEEVVKERLPQTNLYKREDRPVIDLSPRNFDQTDGDPDALSPRFGRSNPFELKQSDEQLEQRNVYKDYLQKQIEEKKKLEAENKERERIEEEKEEKRFEEQRKKIQAELDAENDKERNKIEMARAQNDKLIREAEERRKEQHNRRFEDDSEIRKQKEQELNERLRITSNSPPVPTLQNKQPPRQDPLSPRPQPATEQPRISFQEETRTIKLPPPATHTPRITTYRTDSPIQQDNRRAPHSRAESKRVSRELSALRKQLLSEQRRVENQLKTVELTGQPQPRQINTEYLVDLSRAKQKPVTVRRPTTVEKDRPSSRALREFTDYKYRPDDTASIRMFRAEYPETPDDAKALERQQQALIARQGRNLEDLRQQKKSGRYGDKRNEPTNRNLIPPSVAQSRTSLLDAETTYIPIMPDDDDDNQYQFQSARSSPPQSRDSRRPSARERRRMTNKPPSAQSERQIPPRSRADNYSLNSLSSLATLDVDRLANKNHDRLEKLRVIQGDDVSLTDPDDILDRFVNKQKGGRRRPTTNEDEYGGMAGPSSYRHQDPLIQSFHTRPPSVNTVDTEPWLRPETGPTVA